MCVCVNVSVSVCVCVFVCVCVRATMTIDPENMRWKELNHRIYICTCILCTYLNVVWKCLVLGELWLTQTNQLHSTRWKYMYIHVHTLLVYTFVCQWYRHISIYMF